MTTTILGTLDNNCRLEVDWNSPYTVTHGTKTLTVTASAYFYSSVAVTDNNNSSAWTGFFGNGSETNPMQTTGGTGRRLLSTHTKTVTLTGSGQTAQLSFSLMNIEYVSDGQLDIVTTQAIPARPAPPAPSGLAVSYNAGTNQAALTWTTNNPSPATDENIVIQRADGTGAFTTAVSLGASTTSWTDTAMAANKRYRYRVASAHPYATSAYSTQSGYTYTAPTAPTIGTPVKNADGSITVPFTDRSAWEDRFEVWDSPDGTTWTLMSDTIGPDSTDWTHLTPNQAVTHRYRLRAVTPSDLASAYSATSAIVQLQAAPAKPTNLTPSGVPTDVTAAVAYAWRHNPVDSTPQSAYELRWVDAVGAQLSTTGKVTSTTQGTSRTYGTNGTTIRYQVRTWGAHADASPWSDVVSFPAYTKPVVTINSPANAATITGSEVAATWTTYDAASRTPSGATVVLYDATRTTVLRTFAVAGDTATQTITGLADATGYQVGVVASINGQNSAEVFAAFTVAYAVPPTPVLTATWDAGKAVLAVTNPAGTPDVVSVEYYADGVHIGSSGPNGGMVDQIPDLAGVTYTARAVSALPSSAESVAVPLVLPASGLGIHLNAGAGWSDHAALWAGAPSVDDSYDVDVDLDTYAGDVKPSATFGQSESRQIGLSGLVWYSEPAASREAWRAVLSARTAVCYRDPVRKLFGAIRGIGFKETNTAWGAVSLTFVETGLDEADLSALDLLE